MKYKTFAFNKLLDDKYCELRDYQLGPYDLRLIHCLKDRKTCDHLGEDYMILTKYKQKTTGKVVNNQQSKFYPYKYNLIYKFLFRPTGKVEREVLNPERITFSGNRAIIT